MPYYTDGFRSLTARILKILREELMVLVRGSYYTSPAKLAENIERFANCCLQDTHPHMFHESDCFTQDEEMMTYLKDLRDFTENGGFDGNYLIQLE